MSHSSVNILTKRMFTKLVIAVYCALGLSSCNAEIKFMSFNSRIHEAQQSASTCVLETAHNFFQFSSNICIVTSALKNITNLNIAQTTDRMILDKLMLEYKWTISTVISGTARNDKVR